MARRDPDEALVALFKNHASLNNAKSLTEGRPIFDDVEVVEVRFAGSKDAGVYRSNDFSHWEVDEETGEQLHLTYAERWPKQYQQFKAKQQQTKSGTPLDYVPFLTDGKRSELRALNIYTIEALAELDGQPLKNLGVGGRELKNRAIEYLASSSHDGTILRQQSRIEALETQIRLLMDDKKIIVAGPRDPERPADQPAPVPPEPPDEESEEDDDDGNGTDERTVPPGPNVAAELIGMSRDELRSFIVEKTGKRPVGNPSMRNLVRIAQELGR